MASPRRHEWLQLKEASFPLRPRAPGFGAVLAQDTARADAQKRPTGETPMGRMYRCFVVASFGACSRWRNCRRICQRGSHCRALVSWACSAELDRRRDLAPRGACPIHHPDSV